jgi:hypothetical protein
MIGPKLMEEVKEGFEKLNKSQIFAKMLEKEKNSSPEEQAKVRDIKKNLARYLSKGDLTAAQKYLKHLRENEGN